MAIGALHGASLGGASLGAKRSLGVAGDAPEIPLDELARAYWRALARAPTAARQRAQDRP